MPKEPLILIDQLHNVMSYIIYLNKLTFTSVEEWEELPINPKEVDLPPCFYTRENWEELCELQQWDYLYHFGEWDDLFTKGTPEPRPMDWVSKKLFRSALHYYEVHYTDELIRHIERMFKYKIKEPSWQDILRHRKF